MSWILIAVTAFVIFLLFYMAIRIICWGPGSRPKDEEEEAGGRNNRASISYFENEIEQMSPIKSWREIRMGEKGDNKEEGAMSNPLVSGVESQLRTRMFHLLLAEKEYQQLELDVWRLANILSVNRGINPEECLSTMKRELKPLTTISSFQSHPRQCLRVSQYLGQLSTEQIISTEQLENQANVQRSETVETMLDLTTPPGDEERKANCDEK